jgi:hypothetical protein
MTKKRYIKYGPKGLLKIVEEREKFEQFFNRCLDEMDVNDIWEFEVIELTEEQFNQLKEFRVLIWNL